ncbi:GNAT superfamily N-acetyltransferase [Alkalihalobacillus xiaoxiensis]|uniref:GNAT superfamily N-acetyltransferase n=1 Tax=Shouchella xiaoxiensis TaxID=766895 RepID=A0ABS2SXZ0_9BACI|nr:GNAT family N-acetyltransferase [Shouchella xiaoxiensis]MBM7840373.1 GNAT superfamily N-acetyltransferase [Shouchella xiaoxiensis]
MTTWYEKLAEYFPVEEMKSEKHMELLLREKSEIYHKDESNKHVLMYVETEDFVFVDYLFVSSEARGEGLGQKLIEELKKKKKPIILEVEPIDYEDTDTEKRQRFYAREGFNHAVSIGYRRRSLATNKVTELEILYWSPENEDEHSIYEKMKHTYEVIHTYKDKDLYGQSYEAVEDVLTLNSEQEGSTKP